MSAREEIDWTEGGMARCARWRSENATRPPKRVMLADDEMPADVAYKLACEGTALLWRGDFQNARQLLKAISRRVDRKGRKQGSSPAESFHLNRQANSRRRQILGMLLIPLEPGYVVPLRRAPDVREACTEVYGPETEETSVTSLRELLGLIGAHEWRTKGVWVPALDARIHPHYGVFAPTRGEYVDVLANAPLPSSRLAFDIGTGTGVLAAVLAHRGVERIVATERDTRALACARDNVERLGLTGQVEVTEQDMFPQGRAPLVVCNPPWVPARPTSVLDSAVYDPESQMLRGFLDGLPKHLEPGGEGWLVLSDLAEHLGLRSRSELLDMIDTAGFKVLDRLDVSPKHPRAFDDTDPLHQARTAETTSLWRLAAQ